jgi:hypothetical protein
VTFRLGRWFVLPWLPFCCLLYLATATGNGWLLYLAVSCLGLLAADLMFRPARRDLTIGVAAPARTSVGARTTWHVVVTNTGVRTSDAGWLDSSPAGFEPVTVAVPRLEPGARTEVVLERLAIGRAGPGQQEIHLVRPGPFLQLMRPPTGYRTAATVVHPALVAAGTSPPGAAVTAAPGGAPVVPGGRPARGARVASAGDATRESTGAAPRPWASCRGRTELPQGSRLALSSSARRRRRLGGARVLVALAAVEALQPAAPYALVLTENGVVTLVGGTPHRTARRARALRDPVLPRTTRCAGPPPGPAAVGTSYCPRRWPLPAPSGKRFSAVTGPSGVRLLALSSHPAVPV